MYCDLLPSLPALLIPWYESNRKALPWRENPTPYHVWISEIMLQQTRIEAALPYYTRFLEAFPDIQALAAASEDELLKKWQGLGYYSRARNLKKAALLICERYDGELPREAKELKKLPGIGDYTAGAIASIAMGLPEPAVDGNVLRVIMRLSSCEDDVMNAGVRTRVAEELRQIYPTGKQAGLFTEALMELGETVCLPNGAPKCESCPLFSLCRARADGTAEKLPVRTKPAPRRIEERTVLLCRTGNRYALRRRTEGLLAGMWEPPGLPGRLAPEEIEAYFAAHGAHLVSLEPLGAAKHIFSHVEWHMQGYLAVCDRAFDGVSGEEFVWADAETIREAYAIPAAFRAYCKAFTGKTSDI